MLTKTTIEANIAEGSACILPGIIAMETAHKVMADNQREKADGWLDKSILQHVQHAYDHIVNMRTMHLEPGQEDHLAHALTRIAMAITLRERQKDDQPAV